MVVSYIAIFPHARRAAMLLSVAYLLALSVGCQTGQTVSTRRLIEHQALIDFSGLAAPADVDSVKVTGAVPNNWDMQETRRTALYAHQQWKSPSTNTGVGVAHVRLPLPFSEKTILWLAKREYTDKSTDGREIRQWTDALGRTWFEAENNKYHVQGYVLSRGFEAWLIYYGYKTGYALDIPELSIAARSVETFVPHTGGYSGEPKAELPAADSPTDSK